MKTTIRRAFNRKQNVRSCSTCGKGFVSVWVRKKLCDECGIQKRAPHAGRPSELPPITESRPNVADIIAGRSAAGNARSVGDILGRRPDYVWRSHIVTPFSLNASKNRRWTNNGRGGVYLNDAVRGYQDGLIMQIRAAAAGQTVWQNKLWVGLFVQKDNHRSDAINVVDTICDALKVALDLDDRWFCLDSLDWEVCKVDPKIFISIGQTETCHRGVCSHCGLIKGLEHFNNHKSGIKGKQRVCIECSRLVDADRRKRKRLAKDDPGLHITVTSA